MARYELGKAGLFGSAGRRLDMRASRPGVSPAASNGTTEPSTASATFCDSPSKDARASGELKRERVAVLGELQSAHNDFHAEVIRA